MRSRSCGDLISRHDTLRPCPPPARRAGTVGAGVLCYAPFAATPASTALGGVDPLCTAVIAVSASETHRCRVVNAAFTGERCDFA
jgi:hypothetical protein